jgi:GT2 family glycosyltransferase
MVFGANFAIKRDIIEKMGGFDTSIEFYGEDTNIARRASTFGKVKFKMSFFLYTSGRRLTSQGFLKTGFIYIMNYFWIIFKNKPKTNDYKDFR